MASSGTVLNGAELKSLMTVMHKQWEAMQRQRACECGNPTTAGPQTAARQDSQQLPRPFSSNSQDTLVGETHPVRPPASDFDAILRNVELESRESKPRRRRGLSRGDRYWEKFAESH